MITDIEAHGPAAPLNADALTAVVADIDGVRDIFPATPSLALAPQVIAAVVTKAADNPHRVDVKSDGDTSAITARIGIRRDTPAPATAVLVADALLDQVPPGQDVTVTIQISRIA